MKLEFPPDIDAIIDRALDEHDTLCSPEDTGHALACAAHDVLKRMVGYRDVDRIWNSDRKMHRLLIHALFWYALWRARETKRMEITRVA